MLLFHLLSLYQYLVCSEIPLDHVVSAEQQKPRTLSRDPNQKFELMLHCLEIVKSAEIQNRHSLNK